MARLAAALLACATLAAAGLAADGFRRHAVPGEGVSLAVPASWIVADSRLPAAVVDRLIRENPRLEPFLRPLSSGRSPMKFIALDPVVRNAFATNVNVVVTPVPAGLGFADYRRALHAELRALGARRVRRGVAVVAGARAVRVEYRFDLSLGTRRTVQTLQYGFLRPGRSVVVTYTTLPSLAARYAATFRRSAASIRFG